MGVNIRKKALELLRSYEECGRYVNLLVPEAKGDIGKEEQSAITALLYTSVEQKLRYDYFICQYAERSIDKIDAYVRDVLRIGLCQIFDMRSIPDYAAVNETVSLARNRGEASFINAVLRCAVRNKDNLSYPPREKNECRYLSVRYSYPLSLVKRLNKIFGEETEALLLAFSEKPNLSLTVNTNKISAEDLAKKLEGWGACLSSVGDNGVDIKNSVSPTALVGFSDGEFFVQDMASRIAGLALGAARGETVVDVCAAPGGKSFFAAIATGDEGRVYSFDIHESKLSLIESGAARLGLENITASRRDANEPDEALFGKADAVICDVPCSGMGVLWKKPDLRYKDWESADSLPALQYEILENSVKYLTSGGRIVYSTCTLNPEENENVVNKFLSLHKDYTEEKIKVKGLSADTCGTGITLLPHKHGTDGFYIAVLRKN